MSYGDDSAFVKVARFETAYGSPALLGLWSDGEVSFQTYDGSEVSADVILELPGLAKALKELGVLDILVRLAGDHDE